MSRASGILLRVGVAFAFIYPPLSALYDPNSWLGYFPGFMHRLGIPDLVLLHGFGIIEVVIALWILSGWRVVWPSMLAALILVTIVAFNFSDFEILFRDISIAIAALALAADNYKKT